MRKRPLLRPSVLPLLALLILLVLPLAACDGETGDHEHTFGEWVVEKEATCTENGTRFRSCECGEKETETVEAGHTIVLEVAIKPTCIKGGRTKGETCSVCHAVLTESTELPATGHSPVASEDVAATCVTDGRVGGTHCSVCQSVVEEGKTIPATGHSLVTEDAVPATCTEDGLTEGSHCEICGETITEQVTIPSNGHVYDEGAVSEKADCAHGGTVTYTCTVPDCPRSYTVPLKAEHHNVKDYGAVGNGSADDTVAFRDAIKAAEKDGMPVYVPAGTYRITKTLTLNFVTLYGYTSGTWTADVSDLPTVCHVNLEEPLFDVCSGSLAGLNLAVQGVTAETTEAAETVKVSGVGSRVSNLRIHSPYIGIKATYNNVGRSVFDNIFIVSAWRTGIDVSGTWDIATLENIEVWNPDLNYPCPTAFCFGKNDALHASNLFAFNTGIGFEFYYDKAEDRQGGCWGSFENCGVDLTATAIHVGEGDHRLTFNGGTYWGHSDGLLVSEKTGDATSVSVAGAEFYFNGGNTINICGGHMVTVTGCNLYRIADDFTTSTIKISGGQGVTISGNTLSTNNLGIQLTRAFKGAANITANTILSAVEDEAAVIENMANSRAIINTAGNLILLGQTFE